MSDKKGNYIIKGVHLGICMYKVDKHLSKKISVVGG